MLDFIDQLDVQQPVLIGHDWGARAAANACGLRPGVASHLVLLSVGYGTNAPDQPMTLQQARNYWYHWFMATPRGAQAVREQRLSLCQMMWDTWGPSGWYHPQDFQDAARAFEGDDWAEVVLHSYRQRWGFVAGDPSYAQDAAKLQPAPVLELPTLVLHGAADTCNHPDSSKDRESYFQGPYARQKLPGIGHFPQREAPEQVAESILRWTAMH